MKNNKLDTAIEAQVPKVVGGEFEAGIQKYRDCIKKGRTEITITSPGFEFMLDKLTLYHHSDIAAKNERIADLEQALRAELDHSKRLVDDFRSCKKVQELEKSTQWYVDFANARDKSLTDEIQRANLAESLVENLQSEVDALQNDLSIAKEANKRYRAQLSRRYGLLPADKAIK